MWKPRTSPDTFQGVGEEALSWLNEVKERLGLPVATEAATPEHVRTALFAGVDYLWIGARTSANPIAVQAIADTIHQMKHKPQGVLVKNPVSEDAALWLGNIERIEQTGVPVIAVHRGCNHRPCWAMAHAVRIAKPELPLLIDPSHMSGDANRIQGLMNKAAELDYNGSMIEVHCCPEKALSDNKQQLTPILLRDSLGPILSRSRSACAPRTPSLFEAKSQLASPSLASLISPIKGEKELIWLRAEIDELDDRLWDTIAARMDVSRRIGEWKKANGVAPLQPERYEQIVRERRQWAAQHGLPEEFAQKLFDIIHAESVKKQK